jgi:triosephosphate isomerase
MNKLIFGNWKMNLSLAASAELARAAKEIDAPPGVVIGVFPSFCAIKDVAGVIKGSKIFLGGQDCFWEKSGAYTGEVSADQLKELGCSHVLVGHSERRQKLGETDAMVNAKVKAVLAAGLVPVLCVGETDDERRSGSWSQVIERQVTKGLEGVEVAGTRHVIIAYEPIWAIGTGKACDPTAAREAHALAKNAVVEIFGAARAKKHFQVIYGGSVDDKNIASYLAEEGIDGALVGGASQKIASFSALIKAVA